jgi:hypothetical protein
MKTVKILFLFLVLSCTAFSQDLIHMGDAGGTSSKTQKLLKDINRKCENLDPNDPNHSLILDILSDLGTYVAETKLTELELHKALSRIRQTITDGVSCANPSGVNKVKKAASVIGVRG